MKKLTITLFAFFIFAQSYAQNCRTIPFQPTFGVIDAADTAEWLKFTSIPDGNLNPSFWNFRPQPGQTNFVPFLSVRNTAVATVTLASPCFLVAPNTTYKLNFTFVGQTPGFMNELSVYLVGSTTALVDGSDPLAVSNRLLKTFGNIPFGTSEFALLITPADFAQVTGSYRIVFRSRTISRPSPADGNYIIESFLTDIALTQAQNYDLQVVAMTGPLSNCDLNNQILSFNIRNRGLETPATYNVCFRVCADGGRSFGDWICQEFTKPIPFNDIVELRLTERQQTFSSQLTTIEARVEFPGGPSSVLDEQHIHLTATRTVPYNISFDNLAVFRNWTISSEKTLQPHVRWHVPLQDGGAMSGRAVIVTSGEASNDRLVSGCIQLQAGMRYQVSFTYSALVNPSLLRPGGSQMFSTDGLLATRENLRLSVGRSNVASEADITLMAIQGFNNTDERTITTYFTPTASGSHFFGFLAHSDALSAGISISNFSIVEAPEPRRVPIFMSFEDYDNHDGWQMFSQNAIDNTAAATNVPPNFIMRGWEMSSVASAHGGAFGLRTYSSPTGGSATTQIENNNNWLISPPIYMEAGVPIEIRYFRRAAIAIAGNLPGEILNIRVSEIFELDSLYRLAPLYSDVVRSTTFAGNAITFTPTRTGVHFVSFQYNSQNRRAATLQGMFLDEISIQCSAAAQEINLSAVRLSVPPPACQLSHPAEQTQGNNARVFLYVKNRTGETIPANSLVAWFEVTNPQGQTTVHRGTHSPSQGNFGPILPYQIVTAEFRHDMRAFGTWSVRAWIAGDIDRDASDDTTAVMQTASTGTVNAGRFDHRYQMGFEPHEDLIYWSVSQVGDSRLHWQFLTNPETAHTGVGSAFIAPSGTLVLEGETNQQTMASPCLRLSPDTTYFVSFFLRKAETYNWGEPLRPVVINTYIGDSRTVLSTNLRSTTTVEGMEYKQHSFFFRPDVFMTGYVIIEALSPRWSTGVFLDNFIILDSVSATTPNLSLSRVWVVSANTCDLSDDTLYAKLVNNGLLQIENPEFSIQFGGQTFSETWQGTIPSDSTVIVRLNQRLTHTAFSRTDVTVTLNVERNLAEDITYIASSLRVAPVQQLPFNINFQTAGAGEVMAWNNLSLPFSEQIQPTVEYWSIGNNGAVFRPTHQAPFLSGVLASNCFVLQGGEAYVISFEYRGANVANPENVQVQIEKADGTIEILETITNIRSTAFSRNSISFQASGNAGEEQIKRIRFFSSYDHEALGIYIRSFSIMTQEQASITDFHITRNVLQIHPNPATTEVFVQSEQEISTLFIHDIRGQLIREIRVKNTEYHLNTTDFPTGVYVFTVVVGNERVSKRIIIND